MTTPEQIRHRLGVYLDLQASDPALVTTAGEFVRAREHIRLSFPFLALMYEVAEAEGASAQMLTTFEATLFEVWWIDRFIADADCVEPCRRKIAMILSLLVDNDYRHVHDPNLRVWAVLRALTIERNARQTGLRRLLRSREVEMLERVISDCESHVRDNRPLPSDLPLRLRALESLAVFLPSDLYGALNSVVGSQRNE